MVEVKNPQRIAQRNFGSVSSASSKQKSKYGPKNVSISLKKTPSK